MCNNNDMFAFYQIVLLWTMVHVVTKRSRRVGKGNYYI